MNIAVILSGGSGSRFGDLKQFALLGGKAVIAYSLSAFNFSPHIDEIAIVAPSSHFEKLKNITKTFNITKPTTFIQSGKTRFLSSYSAVKFYQNKNVNLWLHDAARPLVSQKIISDVAKALGRYEAVGVAIEVRDTVVVEVGGKIESVLPRNTLKSMQTPQAFSMNVLQKSFELAAKNNDFNLTDDCSVIKRYSPNTPIHIVKGNTSNIKLTYNFDLLFLETLL